MNDVPKQLQQPVIKVTAQSCFMIQQFSEFFLLAPCHCQVDDGHRVYTSFIFLWSLACPGLLTYYILCLTCDSSCAVACRHDGHLAYLILT